jgi:hypothetical protein
MTEREWLEGTDPAPMFELIDGRAGTRKLRLFACACCRHLWPLLPDELREHCRQLVELAERYADGLATRGELLAARNRPSRLPAGTTAEVAAHWAALETVTVQPVMFGYDAMVRAARTARSYAVDAVRAAGGNEARAAEWRYQAGLLREFFGNPFCPPRIEPA